MLKQKSSFNKLLIEIGKGIIKVKHASKASKGIVSTGLGSALEKKKEIPSLLIPRAENRATRVAASD